VTPVTTYCGEYYNAKHAWKDLQAEEEEYRELLTLQEENITTTQNIPPSIPHIPCHTMRVNISQNDISSTVNTPTEVERIQHQTRYVPHIPTHTTGIPKQTNIYIQVSHTNRYQ